MDELMSEQRLWSEVLSESETVAPDPYTFPASVDDPLTIDST